MRKLTVICFAFVIAAAGTLVSCHSVFPPSPVKIIAAQIVIGNDNTCQKLVGIHYTLTNTDSNNISGLSATFLLYDTSGNPVPLGNNYFKINVSEKISAGSEVTACTSLDSSFSYLPQVGLVADQFHIYKVDFTNGSSWTDWVGQYYYPYPINSVNATP